MYMDNCIDTGFALWTDQSVLKPKVNVHSRIGILGEQANIEGKIMFCIN